MLLGGPPPPPVGGTAALAARVAAAFDAAARGDGVDAVLTAIDACLAGDVPVDAAVLTQLPKLPAPTATAWPPFMADHTQADWRLVVRVLPQQALVVGGRSAIFPTDGCTWVAANAPDARCVVFERCGHWLYIEQAAEFVEVVCVGVEGADMGSVVE